MKGGPPPRSLLQRENGHSEHGSCLPSIRTRAHRERRLLGKQETGEERAKRHQRSQPGDAPGEPEPWVGGRKPWVHGDGRVAQRVTWMKQQGWWRLPGHEAKCSRGAQQRILEQCFSKPWALMLKVDRKRLSIITDGVIIRS